MYDQSQKQLQFDTFRRRLAALIDSKHMLRKDLAKAINATPGTVTRYMTTDRDPDIEFVYRMAKYFGVSMDWLVGASDSRSAITPELKKLMNLYNVASESDRLVIMTLLSKYEDRI